MCARKTDLLGCRAETNTTLSINSTPSEGESQSCSVMSDPLWHHGLHSPWNSPGQNTGVGSLSLLQAIFPTQGLNPGLLHCRWILYQLSHKGSNTLATPWTVARQDPLSMGFSRQECWGGLPFPSPGDLPDQGSNPGLLHCRQILYWLTYEGSPVESEVKVKVVQLYPTLCDPMDYTVHGILQAEYSSG